MNEVLNFSDLCKMTSMSQRPWIACHSHPNQNHGIFQELPKTGSPHALDPNVYLYLEMWESKERAWVEAIVGTKTLNNTHHINTKLKTYWLVVQYRYVFWRPAPTLSCFLKKYVWRNIATHKVWSLKSAKKKVQNQTKSRAMTICLAAFFLDHLQALLGCLNISHRNPQGWTEKSSQIYVKM